MENILNTASSATATPVSRKHTDKELLDILKRNEELSPLEAYAKKKYGTLLNVAIEDDEAQSVENRTAENFVVPASLVAVAVLRAKGVMKGE